MKEMQTIEKAAQNSGSILTLLSLRMQIPFSLSLSLSHTHTHKKEKIMSMGSKQFRV
jgi:hypothetical protein